MKVRVPSTYSRRIRIRIIYGPDKGACGFVDFLLGRTNNFGRQLVPRFDNANRKNTLAACQMRQLKTKFEPMVTKIWIGRCLEELIIVEVHPPMEYVVHQDQVSAQPQMNQ